MTKYLLRERDVPLDDLWDVIVAGGGPAGCTAAAAAARAGARTLLVERTGTLGGMGTSGLVPAWCPFTDKQRIIYGGMAEKVLRETMAGMPHVPPECFDWTPIDPERLKRVYDELIVSHGATVLFGAFVTGVELDMPGRVGVLLVADKSGLSALRGKVYVDCTGDADVAAWAGARFELGDPDDGDLQPATHCFKLSNVDDYAYLHAGRYVKHGNHVGMAAVIRVAIESGRYPEIPDTHFSNNMTVPGTVGFNAGHFWGVDNTKPKSVSAALFGGRKLAEAFCRALREFFPAAFGNAYVAETGSLMGIRETRRIVGDYILTMDDWMARRSFSDEICRNNYFIDIHHKKEECAAFTTGARQDGQPGKIKQPAVHMGPGESHGVPYRCLLPVGILNVIVAGRSISTDRIVQGSTRVMPVCLAMGEAAGLAAAISAHDDANVHSVDVQSLRKRLRHHGAYLPETDGTQPENSRLPRIPLGA